jgi:hypothetical protein
MLIPPRAPFERWPVQHRDPHYGYAWYCGNGIVVSHITATHGTVEAAHHYHDYEESVLRDHAADLKRVGGLFVIHDWRAMQTYDGEARRVWQERMRGREKGYLRGSVVCVARAGPLLRMAVQAANVVASVVHGAEVKLSDDLNATLKAYDVTAPSADS